MFSVKTNRPLEFSQEQEQLLDIATNFCRAKSSIAHVRGLLDDPVGYDPATWAEIADLGWLGIAIPEQFGGSGLGLAECVTVMEPMGGHLMATPFLCSTLAGQTLLSGGNEAQKQRWLPQICEGAVATLALSELHGDWDLHNLTAQAVSSGDQFILSGTKTFVPYAKDASVLIVSVSLNNTPALVLIERASLPKTAITRENNIDETQRTYRLSLDGITVPQANLLDGAKTGAALKQLHLAANLLFAAEMTGGIGAVLEYTLEYLKTRKQFDRLIGSYQALKHTMADVYLGYEAARNHLYYAAGCYGKEGLEGEIALRMAKAQACEILAFAADRSIQFHGGFGFTYDCDAQLYRRRAIWGASCFGDAAFHREKLAQLLL